MRYTNHHTRSFYIHWPFCPYKCHFCPFVALAGHDEYMHDYHQALKKEIERFVAQTTHQPELDTIYFGGGTPSTYPPDLLLDMFGTLRKTCHFSGDIEITLEVNPGTVTKEKLKAWKQIGINRLSLGVQSLNNDVLKDLNRHQSRDDVVQFLADASPLFDNISIDLIIGLPGVTPEEWKSLLQEVVTWPIQHISVYFLTVHEGTALFFRVKKKTIKLPNEDQTVDLFLWTIDYLREHGFEQYETSSFAKKDRSSQHNQVYWQYKPYKGFGMGAWSFDGTARYQQEKNLALYLQKVEQNEELEIIVEHLNAEQQHLERIMLGLRQVKHGLCMNDLFEQCSEEKKLFLIEYIKELEQKGFIRRDDQRISLTPRGVILENEIVVNLSR